MELACELFPDRAIELKLIGADPFRIKQDLDGWFFPPDNIIRKQEAEDILRRQKIQDGRLQQTLHQGTCTWALPEDEGCYYTSCGSEYNWTAETHPDMKFCPYCGNSTSFVHLEH